MGDWAGHDEVKAAGWGMLGNPVPAKQRDGLLCQMF